MYGIDIKTLDKFITAPQAEKKPWGSSCVITNTHEFGFERIEIASGKSAPFSTNAKREATIFVEEGAFTVGKTAVERHHSIHIAPKKQATLRAKENTVVYVFRGAVTGKKSGYGESFKTTDFRDKYWGTIETIVSTPEYAAKRMLVKKGCAASLEYHCRKMESYFIHSGKLLLRLRAGRGEDRFFEMDSGTAALIPPGLMHQRGGIEDAVIVEISTKDEDADSFLVEDGAKHKMPCLVDVGQTSGKRICFDIDGVLCNQVKGGTDYRKARPNKEAIFLVNKLYDEGHTIYLFTARFMGRNKNDWRKAYEDGYAFTKKQLEEWGVKHHGLFLGKPTTDIFVDDRAVFYKPDLKLIEKEIRKR